VLRSDGTLDGYAGEGAVKTTTGLASGSVAMSVLAAAVGSR
jgi:hypothetical protein